MLNVLSNWISRAAGKLQAVNVECAKLNLARRSLLSAAAMGVLPAPALAAAKTMDLQSEIDRAARGSGVVRLPAGTFETVPLKLSDSVWLQGVPGLTELLSRDGGPVLNINDAQDVSLSGITFTGKAIPSTEQLSQSGLVEAHGCRNLRIEDCAFSNSPFSGLKLDSCSGSVSNSRFFKLGQYGLFSWNSKGLLIANNNVSDIGNNGILVWRSETGPDGTQVIGNRVSNIRADAGGNGQNGNGINIFRAGDVITANNHISDTAFSSIRYNSGSNSQIMGNSCLRSGEVALFVEFSYEGAIVANNIIDNALWGIEITNLDVGGRLATCTGNMVRNIHGGMSEDAGEASGIVAEAETLINNNVVENVKGIGIRLGWGPYARNVMAQGNIIRNSGRGIVVSTSEGAGQQMVTGNMISGSKVAAIQGMDHNEVTIADLSTPPPHIIINNNSLTS